MDEKKGLYALWKGVSQRAGDRRSGLLLLAGLAGMVLILLSALPGSGGGEAAPSQPPDTQAYLEELEDRLEEIVGQVDGVGRCRVMVTAENGVEYVYAVEESENRNTASSYGQDGSRSQTQQQTSDQRYILLDSGGAAQNPAPAGHPGGGGGLPGGGQHGGPGAGHPGGHHRPGHPLYQGLCHKNQQIEEEPYEYAHR